MRVSHAVNNKSCCHREVTPVSKFPAFGVTKTNPPQQWQIFTCVSLPSLLLCEEKWKMYNLGQYFIYSSKSYSSHKGFCKKHTYITHSPIWCCRPPKQLFQGHMVSHIIIKFQWFRWAPFIWLSLKAMTEYMISYQIHLIRTMKLLLPIPTPDF